MKPSIDRQEREPRRTSAKEHLDALELRVARRADQLARLHGPKRALAFWLRAEGRLLGRVMAQARPA